MMTRRVMLWMPGLAFAQAPAVTALERRAAQLAQTPRPEAEAQLRDDIGKDRQDAVATLLLSIVRMEALREQPAQLFQEVTPLFAGLAERFHSPTDRAAVLEVQAALAQRLGEVGEARSMRSLALEIRQKSADELFPRTPVLGAEVFKIGKDVIPPKLQKKREPEYRALAQFARWQGTVVLTTVVGAGGKPLNLQLRHGLGLGLDEQAVAAVREWRFEPARRNGEPVNVEATIEVNFRLL